MVHECLDIEGDVRTDDDGRPLAPDVKTCWGCLGQWCDRCDPTPAALCVFCHGRGWSDHELDHQNGRYHNGRSKHRILEGNG